MQTNMNFRDLISPRGTVSEENKFSDFHYTFKENLNKRSNAKTEKK